MTALSPTAPFAAQPAPPTVRREKGTRALVVRLPGLNRDRDMLHALRLVTGSEPMTAWASDAEIPATNLIVVPGGFSYGDYLRAGAIAARQPVMRAVAEAAAKGTRVLGVCNGFQILCEAGLLPGALMRNASLRFACRDVRLEVAGASAFTARFERGQVIRCPIAHHDGNYRIDPEGLKRLRDEDRIAFRYADGTNPNGSVDDIAGVVSQDGNVLGLMPHPENLVEPVHGGTDGRLLLEGALGRVDAGP